MIDGNPDLNEVMLTVPIFATDMAVCSARSRASSPEAEYDAERNALIAKARREYAAHGEALSTLTGEEAFVSCSLRDAGQPRLTEEEIAGLDVADDRRVSRPPVDPSRTAADRATAIAKARREYAAHGEALSTLTSEEAFVNCSLQDVGHRRMSVDEAMVLGIHRGE